MTVLERIEARLASYRKPDGRFPWWTVAVGGGIVLVAAVIAWWIIRRDAAELARLRAEKFDRGIDDADRKMLERVMVSDKTTEAAKTEARQALIEVDALELNIDLARRAYEDSVDRIHRIRSWRDLRPGARQP